MSEWLVSEGHADRAALDKLHDEVKAEIDSAVKFALAAPYPSVDKVDQDVYA
jgi:TPP-dependent pyruvate/acetoin dehydrogenase alpha subunit